MNNFEKFEFWVPFYVKKVPIWSPFCSKLGPHWVPFLQFLGPLEIWVQWVPHGDQSPQMGTNVGAVNSVHLFENASLRFPLVIVLNFGFTGRDFLHLLRPRK